MLFREKRLSWHENTYRTVDLGGGMTVISGDDDNSTQQQLWNIEIVQKIEPYSFGVWLGNIDMGRYNSTPDLRLQSGSRG